MKTSNRVVLVALVALGVAAPGAMTAALGQNIQLAQQEERRFLPRLFGRDKDRDDGGFGADTTLRLDQLESQVRSLTGQVELLSYQLQQLTRALEAQGTSVPDAAPVIRQRFDDPAAAPAPDGSATLGAPPQTLGTLDASALPSAGTGEAGGGGPMDLSALNRGVTATLPAAEPPAPPPPAAGAGGAAADQRPTDVASVGDASTAAFANAIALLSSERHLEAESEFRRFLETYPGDPRAGEAKFWIGESLLGRGAHREAANAYLESYTDHPDSSKAPESLLKLGVSLEGMGEREAACSSFEELITSYPNASPDILEQARQGLQSVGCS